MKIMNKATREATDEIRKTPVSDLPSTDQIPAGSLIHLVTKSSDGGYHSKKMLVEVFQDKTYLAVDNTFKVYYHCLHDHGQSSTTESFRKMAERLVEAEKAPELAKVTKSDNVGPSRTTVEMGSDFAELESAKFVEHVNYDFEVVSRYVLLVEEELNEGLEGLTDAVNGVDYLFQSKMRLTTRDSKGDVVSKSVMHDTSVDESLVQMKIDEGNRISNEWEVPATGNLVIWGWLDSSGVLNNKALPSCYCSIQAKIQNLGGEAAQWETVAVQPVIPAKTFTYVGFNLAVHQGLTIRVKTGFAVGAKSGQFSNEQDGYDTLADSTVNGFKCQVYSRQ